jgi:arylsulfatase A-like enzyme
LSGLLADIGATKKKIGRRAKYPVWPAPYLGNLSHAHTTLPEALKKQGYASFFAGKWHLGHKAYRSSKNPDFRGKFEKWLRLVDFRE